MQNLTSKILCIFVTGGMYAPYAPCLSTPLLDAFWYNTGVWRTDIRTDRRTRCSRKEPR